MTVAKVKRFPTPADRVATCYVGRKAWGWPQTPWANPFVPKPLGAGGSRVNVEEANRKCALQDSLDLFTAHAAGQPDTWWADLWESCRHGELPLSCWCASGHADDLQHACHAAILGAELNRRFVDLTTPKE